MIIIGWGHRMTKVYGEMLATEECACCSNKVRRLIVRYRYFFTIFFIPVIPYETSHFMVCPICGYQMILLLNKPELMPDELIPIPN